MILFYMNVNYILRSHHVVFSTLHIQKSRQVLKNMQFLDAVVYINLDRRVDRKEHITNELKKWKDLDWSKVHRFSAIEGKLVGCLSSHLSVLRMARDKKWTNVLILEDDFTWEDWVINSGNLNSLLENFWTRHQHEFGFVQLAHGLHQEKFVNDFNIIKNDESIVSVKKASNAAAYWVHNRCYDALINVFEQSVIPLYITGAHWLYLNDVVWDIVRPKFNTYAFFPRLGFQYANYSDLSENVS